MQIVLFTEYSLHTYIKNPIITVTRSIIKSFMP